MSSTDPLPAQPSPPVAASPPPRRRPPAWLVAWAVPAVLLFVMAACWALGTPRYSAPDEPDHVLKAAATVRGQTGVGPVPDGFPDQYALLTVPESLTLANQGCYAFYPDVPAACQTFLGDTGREVEWPSSAARYPPLFYVVPGLPSLLDTSARSIWWMRLAAAAVAAAAAAAAVPLLRRLPRAPLVLAGFAAALTPMALYSFGVVNPTGLEVALCLAVWAGLLAVALGERPPPPGLVLALGALASAAVLTRQLTALWVAVAVAVVAVAARPGRLAEVVRMPAAWVAGAVVAGATVLQVAWLSWSGLLGIGPDPRAAVDAPAAEVWRTVAGQAWGNLSEMIGVFGWLDAPAPSAVYAAWLLLVGGLVVAAALLGRRRTAAAVVMAVVLTWALSLVLEVQRVASQGYWWQGRYSLPFAVGIPLLAAAGLAADLADAERERRRLDPAADDPRGVGALGVPGHGRLALVVGLVFAGSHVLSLGAALQRFMVGRAGPLRFFGDADWTPPVPALALLGVTALAAGVLAWWLLAARSPLHRDTPRAVASPPVPPPVPAAVAPAPPVVSAAEP